MLHGGQREEKREPPANTCLLLGRWNIYWPISESNCFWGGEKSQKYCFCISSLCLRQQKCCKMKRRASRDPAGSVLILPKESSRNEIRYHSFGRHLDFHFYSSIMHKVAGMRPRSATLPGKGTPINTTTPICLSTLRNSFLMFQGTFHSRWMSNWIVAFYYCGGKKQLDRVKKNKKNSTSIKLLLRADQLFGQKVIKN